MRNRLLARLVREHRTLLLLDGLEPLQHPPGSQTGRIKDPAVQALVRELAASNPGLCVITTRVVVADVAGRAGAVAIDLDQLPPVVGAELLSQLGVEGSEAELRRASEEFGGHGLTLSLLGTYLRDACEGDVRRRDEVPLLDEEIDQGGHARRMLASYEAWLGAESAEVRVLSLVGLFDHPAQAEALAVLRAEPTIPGLTEGFGPGEGNRWRQTLARLRKARLLLVAEFDNGEIDVHPLVRAYFGERLREKQPTAWRTGRERLYRQLPRPRNRPQKIGNAPPPHRTRSDRPAPGGHPSRHRCYQQRTTRRPCGPTGLGVQPLRLAAPETAAKVLFELRKDAARALNMALEELKYAVVTVPAYFNILQRKATLLAGRLAGLEEVTLLNEPTAAALAYGDAVLRGQEKHILVYDLGGGTFDISLLEVSHDEVGYVFCARVVDGDTFLGGDDIDAAVGRWLAVEIEKTHGQPVRSDDHVARERLRRAAERAKMDLSTQDVVTVELEQLELGNRTASDVRIELTRAQLEECAADVLERTRSITRRAVEDVAGLTWDQIDEVILVGGQTLMPAIQRDVEKLTGLKPRVNDRPQLAVALGAGEYGRILSLGREKFHEKTVMNVIALPLGIRLDDNTFETIVQANGTLPHTSRPFPVTTTEDNQPQIHVEVLQGSRDATHADQCIVLGSILMEVPAAPAQTPRFEVVFDVLSDGTMKVIVTDTRRQRQEVLDIVETRRVMAWRDSPQDT